MKIRVKFTKHGSIKFVGHLDMMRYFQKAVRRAKLDVAYSGGYSPHMIMSFASPLGVGVESDGEYFDMEMKSVTSSQDIKERLGEQMADGVDIISVVRIPDGKASNAMALVAANSYRITFSDTDMFKRGLKTELLDFLASDEIRCIKKTKKGESDVDIRPWIYEAEVETKDTARFLLAGGSVSNLKPNLLVSAFESFMGIQGLKYLVCRIDMYADGANPGEFVPLECLGEGF